jgi:hypothetical protein
MEAYGGCMKEPHHPKPRHYMAMCGQVNALSFTPRKNIQYALYCLGFESDLDTVSRREVRPLTKTAKRISSQWLYCLSYPAPQTLHTWKKNHKMFHSVEPTPLLMHVLILHTARCVLVVTWHWTTLTESRAPQRVSRVWTQAKSALFGYTKGNA